MFTELTAAITSTKAAIEIGKLLSSAKSAFNEADFKMKILQLVNALSDTTGALHELKDKFAELEAEKNELARKLKQRDEVAFDRDSGLFFSKSDLRKTTPFCPKCIQTGQEKAVTMVPRPQQCWLCPVCNYADRVPTITASGQVATMGPSGRILGDIT